MVAWDLQAMTRLFACLGADNSIVRHVFRFEPANKDGF